MKRPLLVFSSAAAFAAVASVALSQQVYTAHDYSQAERWMGYNVNSLVDHTVFDVTYMSDGRIFYRDTAAAETMYYAVDPVRGTKTAAFENSKLAAALNSAVGKDSDTKFNAKKLTISDFKLEPGGIVFSARGTKFHCNTAGTTCHMEPPPHEPVEAAAPKPATPPTGELSATANSATGKAKPAVPAAPPTSQAPPRRRGRAPINMSPDGTQGVFIRDNNLYVRTMATGVERQLTTDGITDFGYATDNAGWQHSDAAVATWSDDGRYVATFQMDQRKTGMMYLVPVTNRHPKLEAWHYPLVGDKDVTMIEPVVIDVAAGTVTRLKIAPLQHRSMECDDVSCEAGKWTDAFFSDDDKQLAFVSTSRDHKDEAVELADVATGAVREVFKEHVDSYYGWQAKTDWKYMPKSNEMLWVSERSNFAQLYLVDLKTGKIKNQVTHGDGPVWDIARVDQSKRVVFFSATGKEAGDNPYYRKLYRVNFDGTGQKLLTPEPMTHDVTVADDGATFVDIYGTVDKPETTVLRDATDGKVIVELAKQDISRLLAAGWKPPQGFKVKARDGKTDLYGYMFKPTHLDPAKKYPVIDEVYPGPQDAVCSIMGYGFLPSRGDLQTLADLGFVTLCIDGMGNPHRSKSFHDAHASKPADMGDDTIPDQVAGIKDLASQFSFIDASRVGIWGHSGGGNATVSAMFHFGDFFKVGWSESGNHDNRDYEDDWDERWAGLEHFDKNGVSDYEPSANQDFAKNLKGKLMLVHGTMDDNVPPTNTLLVVDALMKANKDFDLLMVPNAHHGYGEQSVYIMRRRWDYFVKNLAGGTPPAEYQPKSYKDMIKAMYGDM